MGEECKGVEWMWVWELVKTEGRRKVKVKWGGKEGECFGELPLGFFYRSL